MHIGRRLGKTRGAHHGQLLSLSRVQETIGKAMAACKGSAWCQAATWSGCWKCNDRRGCAIETGKHKSIVGQALVLVWSLLYACRIAWWCTQTYLRQRLKEARQRTNGRRTVRRLRASVRPVVDWMHCKVRECPCGADLRPGPAS